VRLVQFETISRERRVAVVEGQSLRLVAGATRVVDLACEAIERGGGLAETVKRRLSEERVSYEAVIGEGRLWPPLDHADPAHLLISGTGLTHLGSAATRAEMHQTRPAKSASDETDSMKLFRLGLDQGKPDDGSVGVQPEWFYKGNGDALARPGHALRVPDFSLDAG